LPDALIIVDAEVHATAVREAKRMGIPVVALMDTDDNPQTVEYPVMASDHTKGSIEWIMNWLRNAMRKAPKPVAAPAAAAAAVKPVSATVSTGPKPHTGKNAG
jgi:small subunit ribosomal protein S2